MNGDRGHLRIRTFQRVLALLGVVALSSCGEDLPLAPVNRSPVVHSLISFPASIAPGDSAVVVCHATDADGDTVVFDWFAYNYLVIPGSLAGNYYNRSKTVVVYASSSAPGPIDSGGVSCYVRDRRGGGRDAGSVRIIIRQ